MNSIHIECLPDETLVQQLGAVKKQIIHHMGKSRVFHTLRQSKNAYAIVDEDPGSAKTDYEKKLQFIGESHGIKKYRDAAGNTVFVLKIKLEDWILGICKKNAVDPANYGLSAKPNELHGIINNRIEAFKKLLTALQENNSNEIKFLQSELGLG